VITTLESGYFTTIQDQGRWGYQAYGMPIAGAMDRYACQVANLLVGNHMNAAVIEMTGMGAAFKFDEEQMVAVCGGDMQGLLNNIPISNWSSFLIPRRGEIRFSRAVSGYRTYMAVRGGFDVPMVLESRSTCTPAKVGGYEGRILRQGDVLHVGQDRDFRVQPGALMESYIPQYTEEIQLRVILGPQDDMFSQAALDTFFGNSYTVTDQSDRTGYRLKGPKVKHIGKADIISEAVWLGAIQVPADGMPFIMTADHQTTRGFAKLGSVIRVDLAKLTQAGPGDSIRFVCSMEEEAVEALRQEREMYRKIKDICKKEG
jgi:antagonist of KipI